MKEGFNFDAIYHYGIRSQETGLLHYFDVACEIIGETDKKLSDKAKRCRRASRTRRSHYSTQTFN